MKIAVIGAGALGLLYGGLLAADGNEVWLLHHREEAASAIEEDGVVIEGVDGGIRRIDVRTTVDASRVGPVDLALVLVKSGQTLPAVSQHEACLGSETRVLSLQNGLTNHQRLRDHLGADRTLHGVVYQGAVLEGPGRTKRSSVGRTILGGADSAFANRVGDIFESAGLESEVVPDPFQSIWEKQLVGVGIKPLAALTRLPNRDLVTDEGVSAMMLRLMEETAAVAGARGFELDAVGTHERLTDRMADGDHVSSMLQDVRAGRKTEIEDVNGAIVEIGREEGIAVPNNEMVTSLVKGLEKGYLE